LNNCEWIASGVDNRKGLEVALAAFKSSEMGRVVRLQVKAEG
jgi:hypothetical protein